MTATIPYIEVQVTGTDSVVYTNQTDPSNANFINLISAKLKRNSTQTARELVLTINNASGRYSSVFTKNLTVDFWIDVNSDGSTKFKVFHGQTTRKEVDKTPTSVCKMTLSAKDATVNLLNTLVFDVINPGETRLGGDLVEYTFNDFADIVKFLMSFSRYNPTGITTNHVQYGGGNITQPKPWNQKITMNALQDLALLAGFDVYVDPDNDLHFESKISTEWPDELTLSTNITNLNELLDAEDEKTRIMMYCGRTIDDVPILRPYRVPGEVSPKTVWRRNIKIAENATGATQADRTASAIAICSQAAIEEYQKVKNRHEYRAVVNQLLTNTVGSPPTFRSPNINDTIRVTASDFGMSSTLLRIIEIEETFQVRAPYVANYRLNDNLT